MCLRPRRCDYSLGKGIVCIVREIRPRVVSSQICAETLHRKRCTSTRLVVSRFLDCFLRAAQAASDAAAQFRGVLLRRETRRSSSWLLLTVCSPAPKNLSSWSILIIACCGGIHCASFWDPSFAVVDPRVVAEAALVMVVVIAAVAAEEILPFPCPGLSHCCWYFLSRNISTDCKENPKNKNNVHKSYHHRHSSPAMLAAEPLEAIRNP